VVPLAYTIGGPIQFISRIWPVNAFRLASNGDFETTHEWHFVLFANILLTVKKSRYFPVILHIGHLLISDNNLSIGTVEYVSFDSVAELWLKIMHVGRTSLGALSRIICCYSHEKFVHRCLCQSVASSDIVKCR